MTYRAHARALAVLALPLIGSNVAQVAMGVTDTLMLGWYSAEALAAITIASTVFFTLFLVGSGFAWAVTPMVAAALGRGDEAQVRRVARMGMWVSTLYGVAVMPILIWAEPILLAIGQEPQVAAEAERYTRIVAWAMVPSLLVMVLKSHLAALERTQVVLWVTVLAALVNALVNYVLIFGHFGAPELGIQGAAFASMALTLVSLVVLVVYVRRATPEYALFQRLWRLDGEAFGRVFRLGWPIGLTTLAEAGLFSASAIMMGWISADVLAAHGVAIQIASLTFVVHLGVSQASTVRAGNALGRGDPEHLKRGGQTAVAFSILFSMLTILVFVSVPETLVGWFLDPDEPKRAVIIGIGATLVVLAAFFQLADGAQVVALGLLRGIQDTQVPMLMAGVSYWLLGIPVSFVLGFVMGWGGVGIWIGLIFGLTAAGVLLMWRFWKHSFPALRAVPQV